MEISMARCPNCQKEIGEQEKKWKYGQFLVQAYSCKCGTKFREYTTAGKISFALRLDKGKKWIKA
jgi:C4-type Zn-finger protein